MTNRTIDHFAGEYHFLSNFYLTPVRFEDVTYNCAESAFQAAKSTDIKTRMLFVNLAPSYSKHKGKQIKLRENWDEIKFDIMYKIVRDKFTRNDKLALLLASTGDIELIEGNCYGDRIWGVCYGKGDNNLGKILMRVRDEINIQGLQEINIFRGASQQWN